MIDTRKRDVLEAEMEAALREYSKAKARLRTFKEKVVELALNNQPVPDELREEIEGAEWDLKYWPVRLTEVKKEYIRMINQVDIPDL